MHERDERFRGFGSLYMVVVGNRRYHFFTQPPLLR
jgi:hypothetical protein